MSPAVDAALADGVDGAGLIAEVQEAIDQAEPLFPFAAQVRAAGKAQGLRIAVQAREQRLRAVTAAAADSTPTGPSLSARIASFSGILKPIQKEGDRLSNSGQNQVPQQSPTHHEPAPYLGGYRREQHRKSFSRRRKSLSSSVTESPLQSEPMSASCMPQAGGHQAPLAGPRRPRASTTTGRTPTAPSVPRSTPPAPALGRSQAAVAEPQDAAPGGVAWSAAGTPEPPPFAESVGTQSRPPTSPCASSRGGGEVSRRVSQQVTFSTSSAVSESNTSAAAGAADEEAARNALQEVEPVSPDWGPDRLLERILCMIQKLAAAPAECATTHVIGGVSYAAAVAIAARNPAALDFPRTIVAFVREDYKGHAARVLPRRNLVRLPRNSRERAAKLNAKLTALRSRAAVGLACFDWHNCLAELTRGQWRLTGGHQTAESIRGLTAKGWWLVDIGNATDDQQRAHIVALSQHSVRFTLAAHSQRVADTAIDAAAAMALREAGEDPSGVWPSEWAACLTQQVPCEHSGQPQPPLSSYAGKVEVLCAVARGYRAAHRAVYDRRFSKWDEGSSRGPVQHAPADPKGPSTAAVVSCLVSGSGQLSTPLPSPRSSDYDWSDDDELVEREPPAPRTVELPGGDLSSSSDQRGSERDSPRGGASPTPAGEAVVHSPKAAAAQEPAAAPKKRSPQKSKSPPVEAFAWGDFCIDIEDEKPRYQTSKRSAGTSFLDTEDMLLGDMSSEGQEFVYGDYSKGSWWGTAGERDNAASGGLQDRQDSNDFMFDEKAPGGDADLVDESSFAFSDFAVSKETDMEIDIACNYLKDKGVDASAENFMFGDFCVDVSALQPPPAAPAAEKRSRRQSVRRVDARRPVMLEGPVRSRSPRWDATLIRGYRTQAVGGMCSRIKCLSLHCDESRFVTCSNSAASLFMLDIRSGRELQAFIGHSDVLSHAIFSRDAKFVATCSRDRSLRVWDVATARQVSQFDHPKVVICACFSANGQYIVSGCQDWICRLYKVKDKRRKAVPIICFREHGGIITNIDFEPTGDGVLSACADTSVRIWSAATGQRKLDIVGHRSVVLTARFSRDGSKVVTNDTSLLRVSNAKDATIIWQIDVASFRPRRLDPGKHLSWSLCCWGPGPHGNRYVVVATNDCVVRVLDTNNDGPQRDDAELDSRAPVYALHAGPNKTLVYGDFFGNLYTCEFV